MPLLIETERLTLFTPVEDDFDHLYQLQTDPDVMKYIGHGVRTKEQIHTGLNMAIKHQAKHGYSLGAVYEKSKGIYIGRAGLIHLAYDDTQPDIEIGYALHKAFWQQGYATELALAMVKWGFAHLSVKRLVGVINPSNLASRHVLEKAGMRYVSKDNYYDIEVDRFEIVKS